MVLAHFVVFLLAAAVLARSATYLVKTLMQIAVSLKLSEFSISFILMALATSLPELSVGISAALEGKSNLALGTVIGSNIADLTLVIGLPALIARGIRIESRVRNRDIFYVVTLSVISLLLMFDGMLSRVDGLILLLLFGFYLYRLFGQQERYKKKLVRVDGFVPLYKSLGYFAVEIITLILSANLLVKTASYIALDLKLSIVLVGLVIVAFGTSLPELSFELFSVYKKQSGLALGDVLGSVVTNSCLILGVAALISPIKTTDSMLLSVSMVFWILVLLLFMTFLRSQYKLSWKEGMILVFIYVLFVVVGFSIESSLNSGF